MWGLENLFSKRPDNKYFHFYQLYGFCLNYSTLCSTDTAIDDMSVN